MTVRSRSLFVMPRISLGEGAPTARSGRRPLPVESRTRGSSGPRAEHPRQPFSAPSVVFMIRRWKTKNSTATGIDISTAAASCSG